MRLFWGRLYDGKKPITITVEKERFKRIEEWLKNLGYKCISQEIPEIE
jgi:signal recognition particle subunit SEC65